MIVRGQDIRFPNLFPGVKIIMADEKTKRAPIKIRIESDEQTRQGAYCNSSMVSHTAEEFLADFLFLTAKPPYGKLHSRILMSPGHAKRLARMLTEAVHGFEKKFGPIKESRPPVGNPDIVH
tara:strand:+ start:780 stop:1145 length:366 start_codon:yes stop_codon:yes gene_type:complete